MGSTFNQQILVEKLSRLNISQTSIETLSHWCIFHMNKATQVVETWNQQFYRSSREQRLAFLYLANDILQNSRRKGCEFVGEFLKVLPDALHKVISGGDEVERNAALRLVGIWEERKVLGSRGQSLKEEIMGRHGDNTNRNEKHFKLKPHGGNIVDKIVSGYQVVYGGQLDEDVILNKCRSVISCLQKVDKETVDETSGSGGSLMEEVQGQHVVLNKCIEQLTVAESSRASLVSLLREALHEQEFKLEEIRGQLQAAQSKCQSEQAGQLADLKNTSFYEPSTNGPQTSIAPESYVPVEKKQPASFSYNNQHPEKSEEDPRKSAAAAVAAQLTASTSSAEMLSFVLSSLASEGVIGNSMIDSSGDCPPDKRPKLEDNQAYIPSPPPPLSSPPLMPPLPPISEFPVSQYMQSMGSVNGLPYSYNVDLQLPGFPSSGAPVSGISAFSAGSESTYQSLQVSEGNFYNPTSTMPTATSSQQ